MGRCVCVCVEVGVWAGVGRCVCVEVWVCGQVCMCVCGGVGVWAGVYVEVWAGVYVCVCTCVCTWRENMWTGVCALSVGDVLLSTAYPVNMPDPIRKHFGYGQLWPVRPACRQIGPDGICRIQFPASDLARSILCKTSMDLIWMAWSGFC